MDSFYEEDDAWSHKPLPEIRPMKNGQYEESYVEQVSPIKHLKIPRLSDEWLRANHHQRQNDHESHTCRIRYAPDQSEQTWFHGEEPLGSCVCLVVDHQVGCNIQREIDAVHQGMNK